MLRPNAEWKILFTIVMQDGYHSEPGDIFSILAIIRQVNGSGIKNSQSIYLKADLKESALFLAHYINRLSDNVILNVYRKGCFKTSEELYALAFFYQNIEQNLNSEAYKSWLFAVDQEFPIS
jgi:hypothetical protein